MKNHAASSILDPKKIEFCRTAPTGYTEMAIVFIIRLFISDIHIFIAKTSWQ